VNALQMPRRRITVSVDADILDALADKALVLNTSVSRMTETALIAHAKALGLIPENYKPLGETRGGERQQSQAVEQ
jgi:hypothetical protein